MKDNTSFEPAELAARVYKTRRRIFKRIRTTLSIERYLISNRSRNAFVAFYKVRLKQEQANQLYRYLLHHMSYETCPNIDQALNRIAQFTHTIELSMASKVIASLDRNKPVYDSVLRGHLKLGHPQGNLGQALAIYEQLSQRMSALLRDVNIRKVLREFDLQFPQSRGNRFLTRIKKLDLILWQWE